ncbi:fused MFS/spermidine synthase [candidate division WOR-3 bacterium]|nr:fused MFS/spermidine synthase [candidate division WOR-3 bacterium]
MRNRKFDAVIVSAIAFVGFSSIVSQVVLMRELLIVFYGNELSLGVTLAGWLFWGGIGSLIMGPFLIRRIGRKLLVFTLGEILLSIFLPVSLIIVRFIPGILKVVSGEIIGIIPMILSSFCIICPVTFLGGTMFVLGCEIFKSDELEKAVPIGYVYVLEAMGATLGGFIASFLLIRFLPGLMIMLLLSFLNLLFAFLLGWRKTRIIVYISSFFILVSFILSLNMQKLRLYTLQQQWKTYKFITSENSIYENITVVSRDDAVSFFTNGILSFTVPDTATSEMRAHIPLLEHPEPKSILVIGGGMSGIMREILKHPVERVDYVEIDPLLIELAKKHLGYDSIMENMVHIINIDGRLFVKRTESVYDVAILNLPEPHTAQTNRFYTVEFFTEINRILSDEGIICFSIYSNPNYMSEEAKELYLSLKETLEKVFADVIITPGETNFFLASKVEGVLTKNWEVLLERARERRIETKYVREYYLFADFSLDRFEYTLQRLTTKKPVRINSDFRPISYYYNMVFWSTYFSKAGYLTRRVLKSVTERRTWISLLVVSVVLLIPILLIRKKKSSYGILIPIATTGFAEITFQVVTLISFQILYGYVFYKLSLILTSYMLGLILGGLWVTRMMRAGKGTGRTYLFTQISIVIYPLVLPLLFLLFARIKNDFTNYIGSNIIFPFLPVIPGIIGGFQFPLANKLFIKTRRTKGVSAGVTYGFDLVGSCIGALIVSIFLIPIIGIPYTCFEVSILNFVSLILIFFLIYPFNRSTPK